MAARFFTWLPEFDVASCYCMESIRVVPTLEDEDRPAGSPADKVNIPSNHFGFHI